MDLSAWLMVGIAAINIVAFFLSFRLLRVIGGDLKEILLLVPTATGIFTVATSFAFLRHLNIVSIRGGYDIFETIWILIVITILYRTHQLFARLAQGKGLTRAGD